jgi:CMP-N,N'-diacetyllegionaminic acid synthase
VSHEAELLVVIPARGGSKGIPGKNLCRVGGRPLLHWTIEHALAITATQATVVVSTDDPEIAETAKMLGAEVPGLRPAVLALDTTPTEPVIAHVLREWLHGRDYPAVMLLQATSPVRLPGCLDRAWRQFRSSGADCLVGVVETSPFLWRQSAAGAEPEYNIAQRPRRQDISGAQRVFRETGSLYVTKRQLYEQQQNRLGGQIELFVMAPVEGIDIDTEHDLRVADQTLRSLGLARLGD